MKGTFLPVQYFPGGQNEMGLRKILPMTRNLQLLVLRTGYSSKLKVTNWKNFPNEFRLNKAAEWITFFHERINRKHSLRHKEHLVTDPKLYNIWTGYDFAEVD